MNRAFDPRLVFVKTAEGAAEVSQRNLGLSGAARRILILLDGRRRLSDLPPFARPEELEPIVDDLASRGLIALAGIADDPPEDEVREQLRRQRETMDRLKQELRGAFERELGPGGLILEARLKDSVSLDVLRQLIREGVDAVHRLRGEEAAERILSIVRPAYAQFSQPR